MKKKLLIIILCVSFLMLLVGCITHKTNKSAEILQINDESLANLFWENENIFSNVALALYNDIPEETTFKIEKESIIALGEDGNEVDILELCLTEHLQKDILNGLQIIQDYVDSCNKNGNVRISVGESFGNKSVDFYFRDTDNWIDYRIIYSKDYIDGTELKDNWYLRINGLI